MKKMFCYLQTPRELIKAEKILIESNIKVAVRPAIHNVFGVCNMALEVGESDLGLAIQLLEASDLLVLVREDDI